MQAASWLGSGYFPGKAVEPCRSLACDDYLGLQLDALLAAFLSDQALDATRHVFFKRAAVIAVEIRMQGASRVFIRHSHPMQGNAVAPRQVPFGDAPGFFVELAETHSRLQHRQIMIDLFECCRIELMLLVAHFCMADRP